MNAFYITLWLPGVHVKVIICFALCKFFNFNPRRAQYIFFFSMIWHTIPQSWSCDVFVLIYKKPPTDISSQPWSTAVFNHVLAGVGAMWGFSSPCLVEALTQFYTKSNVGAHEELLRAYRRRLRGAQKQEAAAQCNHLLNRGPVRVLQIRTDAFLLIIMC